MAKNSKREIKVQETHKTFQMQKAGNFQKNNRCFICHKIGHFAKNSQSRKSVKLLEEIEDYTDQGNDQHQISEPVIEAQEEINALAVIPQVELKVYSSKWDKPTRVIAFIDTGVASSLINPAVLPENQWVPNFRDFNTASNAVLTTIVITKHPVTIEFFPGLKYRTKLLGSDVPGKDLIIGFDIYRQLRDQLQIKANEIAFKK
uniref:Uncharacterized protein LOC104243492 n=1 Tax=Nicotiana sylvestris TaxID=4096 RepID=A0A1U7XYE0_NICSY|nr:PREDICTED: uncharacterized protein LOC104243492 [Nicotiana sylvestris]